MDVIYIIERNEKAAALLRRALEQRDVSACIVVAGLKDDMVENAPVLDIEARMQRPYRLGDLLDRIKAMRSKKARPQIMRFKNCALDTAYCLFFTGEDDGGEGIRLTEKETEILSYLALHSRRAPVKRDDLLAAVWGYGDNIETHTLETHIYRLRQKIEANPAAPEFLITGDEGYKFPTK